MTTESDRELLEAAARAAGIPFVFVNGKEVIKDAGWNPLEDDGDALRLAVKLKLCLTVRDSDTRAHKYGSNSKRRQHHESQGDPYAATRRAIVRAAAIGAHKEGD